MIVATSFVIGAIVGALSVKFFSGKSEAAAEDTSSQIETTESEASATEATPGAAAA